MVLHSFFVPLQGFFNFFVYKYPEFKKWRDNRSRKAREENLRGVAKGNASGNSDVVVALNSDNGVASSVTLPKGDASNIASAASNDGKVVSFSDDVKSDTFFENEGKYCVPNESS